MPFLKKSLLLFFFISNGTFYKTSLTTYKEKEPPKKVYQHVQHLQNTWVDTLQIS